MRYICGREVGVTLRDVGGAGAGGERGARGARGAPFDRRGLNARHLNAEEAP